MIGISYGRNIDVILERLILSVRTHHRFLKADKGLFCWLEIQGQQQRETAVEASGVEIAGHVWPTHWQSDLPIVLVVGGAGEDQ